MVGYQQYALRAASALTPLQSDSRGAFGRPDDLPPAASILEVSNPTTSPVRFNLVINGASFSARDVDVLGEVHIDPREVCERSVALALWRWVTGNRYHWSPYTADQWGHSPALLFNSIGFGFCDDAASALAALARLAGLSARVWALGGHIVPEVRIDGDWAVLDPDLEVYYLTDSGSLAGVSELSQHPALIQQPVLPAAPHWAEELVRLEQSPIRTSLDSFLEYSSQVSDIYASPEKAVNPWYDGVPPLAPHDLPLFLPPEATLRLGLAPSTVVTAIDGAAVPLASCMTLTSPPGWLGTVEIPFVLRDVRGHGRVAIDGERFDMPGERLARRLADRARFARSVTLLRVDGETCLEYLVNATRFDVAAGTVTIAGAEATPLVVTRH